MSGTGRGGRTKVANILPYERVDCEKLQDAIWLLDDEHLLILQPFGWHLDGHHIPNMAEQFSREYVCQELKLEMVCDFGGYIAIVRKHA